MGITATAFTILAKPENADLDLSTTHFQEMDVFGSMDGEQPGHILVDERGNMTAGGLPFEVTDPPYCDNLQVLEATDRGLRVNACFCLEANGSVAKIWAVYATQKGEIVEFDLPDHILDDLGPVYGLRKWREAQERKR